VVAAFGVSPSGSYLGWNGEAGSANMYGELNGCWDEMLAAGQISATEHANATFCSYYRSEEEMRAGFTGERLGLRLKSLEWRPITCPFGRGLGSPAELVGTVSPHSRPLALDKRRPHSFFCLRLIVSVLCCQEVNLQTCPQTPQSTSWARKVTFAS
jgi:hypothetical protein